jgi:hypothetical protein
MTSQGTLSLCLSDEDVLMFHQGTERAQRKQVEKTQLLSLSSWQIVHLLSKPNLESQSPLQHITPGYCNVSPSSVP